MAKKLSKNKPGPKKRLISIPCDKEKFGDVIGLFQEDVEECLADADPGTVIWAMLQLASILALQCGVKKQTLVSAVRAVHSGNQRRLNLSHQYIPVESRSKYTPGADNGDGQTADNTESDHTGGTGEGSEASGDGTADGGDADVSPTGV